jgi:hypothetical protein
MSLEVTYLASSKDGMLRLAVNGVQYTYTLDAAHIPWIKRGLNKSPGKTLAVVKRLALHCSKEVSINDVSGKEVT